MAERGATGFGIVPNWLIRDPSVSAWAKVLYALLASHCGKSGTWYIRHSQLSEEAGCSVSTVKRALQELHTLDVVEWITHEDTAKGNIYRLWLTPRSTTGERPGR